MSCPYFMPAEPLEAAEWLHAPRLPLGDAYRGVCHAQPQDLFEPTESHQRDLCNCGYARGRCGRLADGAPDAVRFSVSGNAEERLRIVWIVEKDCSPVEFGTLDYAGGKLSSENFSATPLLTAQATAFIRSYLDRVTAQSNVDPLAATAAGSTI
jgi:hypothetical protein